MCTGAGGCATLPHSLPKAGLATPTTSTELPQALIGTCTGAWTLLPDATPAELAAVPEAEEPEAVVPWLPPVPELAVSPLPVWPPCPPCPPCPGVGAAWRPSLTLAQWLP